MYGSEYIELMLNDGLFAAAYHFKFEQAGQDLDEMTAHAVVRVFTNECGALIEVLQRLHPLGCTLTGLHRLHGSLTGCLEIDIQLMPRHTRRVKPQPDSVQMEMK
jgi:hypothetical protein